MDGLKRALRKLFGKKDKQETKATSATASRQPQNKTSSPKSQQQQQQAQSTPANETTRPLPPTHPLATGQHEKPQEAVPSRHATADSKRRGGDREGMNGQQGRDIHNVSPPAPSETTERGDEAAAGRSGRVSEAEGDRERDSLPPPPPPKNDDVVEDAEEAGPAVGTAITTPEAHAVTGSSPTHTTLAGARLDPATAPKEQALTNGDTTNHERPDATSNLSTSPAAQGEATHHVNATAAAQAKKPVEDEGKILVMNEEPPQIKAVRTAPGMSATSGPLEDFPEGGPFP